MKYFKKVYTVDFIDDERISKIEGLDADDLVEMFFTTPESLSTIADYIKDAEESDSPEYEAYLDLDAYIPEVNRMEYRHLYKKFYTDTAPKLTHMRALIATKKYGD